MSVKELNFYWPMRDKALVVTKELGDVKLLLRFGMREEHDFVLDRNQAHLLMLYLQEHLGK